jgi:hypothetical protein
MDVHIRINGAVLGLSIVLSGRSSIIYAEDGCGLPLIGEQLRVDKHPGCPVQARV